MHNHSKFQLIPAFVLHSRNYSNSSLLLDFFTLEEGKITAVAKGVKLTRRRSSGKLANLQPFVPLHITWSGRGAVKTLTAHETAGKPVILSGKRLYCGLYLNELLLRLLADGESYHELFAHYTDTLLGLASENSIELLLRRFEVRILESLGYALWPIESASAGSGFAGAKLNPDKHYIFMYEQGLVPVQQGTRYAVSGQTLQDFLEGAVVPPNELKGLRDMMREVLASHLGPKPLKSREMFMNLIRNDGALNE